MLLACKKDPIVSRENASIIGFMSEARRTITTPSMITIMAS